MREQLGSVKCWLVDSPPQEQVYTQNRAEQEFEFYRLQAELLGIAFSPIKRTIRMREDEDGKEYMAMYFQKAYIEGSEELIQHLKDIMDNKRLPVFAELLSDKK